MADEPHKVFISWSGTYTKRIALVWKQLAIEMFDTVDVFVSSSNIQAGARPLDEIKQELDGTSIGIVVTTPDNQNAAWLNFEAGALSRAVKDSTTRVMPSLVGFDSPSQVTSPLKQYQAKMLDKEGVESILQTIASTAGVDWSRKEQTFERAWAAFSPKFDQAIQYQSEKTTSAKRSAEDMLDEVLGIVRELRSHNHNRAAAENFNVSQAEVTSRAYKDVATWLSKSMGTTQSSQSMSARMLATGQILFDVHIPSDVTAEEADHLITRLSIKFPDHVFRAAG
ncbi:hypothetical protein [Rhodococcoides fascians]|uniref:hypothetical protein n=1 Tax=Rhodococcoides fascians TaxID=1828 RepID=UPI001D366345|nr:hypothetical protein [Rhodococcus fascians]CAH0189861.1 hypothetical protein SRABI91_01645 [Rhodococcus fascians]